MSDFFGDLIVKAVPLILPVLLVLSFFVNTKGPLPKGNGGSGEDEKQQQKSEKKASAPKKETAPAPAPAPAPKQEQSLDAPISDEDMT